MTATVPNHPPLILVVDDDTFMRLQLRQTMEQEGYQTLEASNAKEGLELYTRFHPDIVLLDAMMPVMDGFTGCSKLQALPGGASTPVLMITGLDDQASVDRAFEVGATDYITKPIHWAVLRQRVKRLLQQSQLSSEKEILFQQQSQLYQQLEQANLELQRLACLDGLTQLANRRRFDEYFNVEWWRMMREQTPLSLILCDIDFFKAYNDTYGHIAGDNCLQQVATAITTAVKRPADLVARYGGEEFAVILPNTDVQGAIHVAEKIRSQVKALEIVHINSSISPHITLSLGVATTVPSHESNPTILLAMADKALYKAKELGRNKVVME